MIFDLSGIPAFGVAGNFTGHLEQAGEARDFINVKTADASAPKAIFPTYIPGSSDKVPEFLHIFPFDSEKIIYPAGEQKLQIEPECAIICDAQWSGVAAEKNESETAEPGTRDYGSIQLKSLKPVYFGASNDCSIRKEGAKKISQKKNWGKASKGFSSNAIKIDSFDQNGILNKYRIASFLVRDGIAYQYGEDSCVRAYSYIYDKLLNWCIDKFNNQQNEGPAELIHDYLTAEKELPSQIMISIGATRYTAFGQENFLRTGDKSVVVLYPEDKYLLQQIKQRVEKENYNWEKDISPLIQTVKTEL